MAWLWKMGIGVSVFAAALVLLLGCGGKTNNPPPASTSVTISGTVTFTGYALLTDTNGVPTGLDIAHPTTGNPARAILVRVVQSTVETLPNGTKTTVWSTVGAAYTDASGKYSMDIPVGTTAYVEVVSISNDLGLHVVADRITSTTPINDRSVYSLRKAPDGTDGSTSNPTPGLAVNAAATVNFDIGPSTCWWTCPLNANQAPSATLETTGSGSRIAAIIDTAYVFSAYYGSPSLGTMLDLHYQLGQSETRGSYISPDRSKNPLESGGTNSGYDSTTGTIHYFGTLRGGPVNNDAFDQGVILPLLARNWMVAKRITSLLPPASPLTDLSAEMALVEGFPNAMAANILKSPYLADTDASGAIIGTPRDIRDISGLSSSQKTPLSAPNISALVWNLTLKANGITAPGTPDQWTAMNQSAINRIFFCLTPTDTTTTFQNDIPNFYAQLGRLLETQASGEPVNLAAIFTDAEITAQCAPFTITWPRPAAPSPYASFMLDWGADPNTKVTSPPTITFSMTNAQMVNGSYPNVSSGEVAYARFTLSKTMDYSLRIGASLPSNDTASIEVQIQSADGSYSYTRTFTLNKLGPVNLPNMPGDSSTLVFYKVRVRLISPSTLQASIPVTIYLDAN